MGDFSYKQLHQLICGPAKHHSRCCLVANSGNRYVACVSRDHIQLYNLCNYVSATDSCSLRRDKPLSTHPPEISITNIGSVSWLAFNANGSVLSVVALSDSQGIMVHLVHLPDLVKHRSVDLLTISRRVRVSDGVFTPSIGGPECQSLRDFAWSPTDSVAFAVVLPNGELRLYHATSQPDQPVSLVNQLPASVDARCLSWSAKGKQLAICLNGSLCTSGSNQPPTQGPMIIQVDPQLHLKRLIQYNPVLDFLPPGCTSVPLDLLWISPAYFLIGLYMTTAQASKSVSVCAILLHAPTKSAVLTGTELTDLRGSLTLTSSDQPMHYYFHSLDMTNFLATHSVGGEEIMFYQLPSASSGGGGAKPINLLSIELPPAGFPVGLGMTFFAQSREMGLNAYLFALLTNGNLSPYRLQLPEALLTGICSSLPEPTELTPPPPQPLSIQANREKTLTPSPVMNTSTPQSSAIPKVSIEKQPLVSIPQATLSVNSLATPSRLVTSVPPIQQPNTTGINLTPSTAPPTTSKTEPHQPPMTTTSISMPNSVQIAASQFTNALRVEAEAGRAAWKDLFQVMHDGGAAPSKSTATCGGVDMIEAKLHDVELFLTSMNEVATELYEGVDQRKSGLIDSVNYTEELRRALRQCTSENLTSVQSQLDPYAVRMLGNLKRRMQSVELSLSDLDNQLDQIEASTTVRRTSSFTMKDKSKRDWGYKADEHPDDSKVLSAIQSTSRLIRNERARVNYLIEILNTIKLKDVSLQSLSKYGTSTFMPRHSSRDVHHRDEIKSTAPALVKRDRALYKLFSDRSFPVIHVSDSLPSIADDDTIQDGHSLATPNVCEASLLVTQSHPLQSKLENLIHSSSLAASMDSPPANRINQTRLSSAGDSKVTSSPRIHVVQAASPPVSLAQPTTIPTLPITDFKTDVSKTPINQSVTVAAPQLAPSPLVGTSTPVLTPSTPLSFGAHRLKTVQSPSTPSLQSPLFVKSPIVQPSPPVPRTTQISTSPPQAATQQVASSPLFGSFSKSTPPNMITTAPSTVLPSPTTSATTTPSVSVGQNKPLFNVSSLASPTTTTSSTVAPMFGGGLFSNLSAQQQQKSPFQAPVTAQTLFATQSPSTTACSLFAPTFDTSRPTNTTSAVPLFGQSTSSTTPVFGTTIASSTKTTASGLSLFGQPVSASMTPAFDTAVASTKSTISGVSLFSQPVSSSMTPAFGTNAASSTNPTSGVSLFGQPSSPATPALGVGSTAGSLFGSLAQTTSSASPAANLFGQTPSGLFGSSTTTAQSVSSISAPLTTSGGGMFQFSAVSSSGTGGSIFGSATASASGSTGLFNFGASTIKSTTAVPTSATASQPTQGLFSGLFSNTSPSGPTATQNTGGLFGSPPNTQSKDISNLFSGSSFGLGSPFGQPTGTTASTQKQGGLFAQPTSTSSGAGGGMFGAPAFSVTQATTVSVGGGGLFGTSPAAVSSGGLFGSQKPTVSPTGGFGSQPTFGASFGSSSIPMGQSGGLFGNLQNTGSGSLFGSSSATATGGGLFGSLSPKADGPSFGNLAMGSSGAQPTQSSPFGGSPSFTQRRA